MKSGVPVFCLFLAAASCASPAAPPPVPAPIPVAASPPLMALGDFTIEGGLVQGGVVTGTAPPGAVALTLDGKPVELAPDRRFLIGFDRDQPAEAALVASFPDGRVLRRDLRVAPKTWRIERVNIAQRPDGSTEEYRRLRERELARIGAARAIKATSDGWRQRFIWPARGRISGIFGSQRVYRGGVPGAYHSGVDVAAGSGAVVVAPADGIVVLAGPPMFSLEGNLVIIDHGMGLNSAFLHLSRTDVREGQRVKQGQPVGTVGSTGRATGPHLHWSMKWNEARIDPQALAGPM
jgi:hypothetical protein